MTGLGWRRSTVVMFALAMCFSAFQTRAADRWVVEPVDKGAWPPHILDEPGRAAADGLPDGRVATRVGGDIVEAWYGEPTRRYGHGILGDAVEAGSLHARTGAGDVLTLRLPKSEVFEDRTPRLADLDGDGKVEIATIRSSTSKGASVTVYGIVDGALTERGTNGFIGRSNRWLNIAGIADLDGRPGLEMAYVRTPHIGGTLFYFRYKNGALKRVAAIDGFSNHAIGAREMRLSAITDLNADRRAELVLPSKDRSTLRIIDLVWGKPVERASITLPGRIDKAIVVRGTGKDTAIVVGLDNGRVYQLTRQ
ncbi:MAG: hypothetical protein GY933_25360 [Hyphomicrobiales bacterium]|nr:hypothetical protein [Hyphomicrobiales bacterium]